MAKVVAVGGSKGGTGKSSISHLIAHGAGSLPKPIATVVLTTDPEDELIAGERRYLVLDARTPKLLATHLTRFEAVERALVVIDGAANRSDLDAVVADLADVVVVPYGPSAQEADRARRNLERLPAAVALPNRWPTHPQTAKRVRRWLEAVPAPRRLPLFRSIAKLDGWLAGDAYEELAYEVASPARGLALEVLAWGRIDPAELSLAVGEGAVAASA